MSLVFIGYQCPACRGKGCKRCSGTGSIGGSIDIPDIPVPEPTPFGRRLRAWRLEHEHTFRQLSQLVGILPGTLSEIENGRREPTLEQIIKLEELMK